MSQSLDVEIADMDLIKQVFQRQQQHLAAISSYVDSTCRVPGALSGVLSFVAGDYGSACDAAHQGFANGQKIATTCATKTDETKTSMLATDKVQYERYAAHERSLGHIVPAYTPPAGGGALGPAATSADDAAAAAAKFKINGAYPDRLKKTGEVLGYDPNDPFTRSGPNGADYIDPKFWAKRGVENLTDAGRRAAGYGGPAGAHRAPLPRIPEDVGSTVKGVGSVIGTPISAVNNGIGIVTAGQHVQAAQATHTDVDASVNGPSNSGGIDWANSQTSSPTSNGDTW